jgi:hypothetical protein
VVPDERWPKTWRIRWPDGRISDMVNLSRAKDAAAIIAERGPPERDRRRFRWQFGPIEIDVGARADAFDAPARCPTAPEPEIAPSGLRDRRHIATRAVTLNVAAPALDDRAWLNHRRTVVTRNAINANSEALELRDLSSEELDAVSGGFLGRLLGSKTRGQGGQNDPAQMFQQIMQQLTQQG